MGDRGKLLLPEVVLLLIGSMVCWAGLHEATDAGVILNPAWTVLVILAGAVLLFVSGRVRVDVVAVLSLLALVVTGSVTTEEALAGFSSTAAVAVAGLLVVGAGLVRTGVVRRLADGLQVLAGKSNRRLLVVSTAVPAILSGFVNIIAAVTIFIPAILRMSKHSRLAPQKLLLPMAATSLVGANLTLIGAGHNLVVNSLLQESGFEKFGFFEFTLAGAALVIAVVGYNLAFAFHLLPAGEPQLEEGRPDSPDHLVRLYGLADYLWEVWVQPESGVVQKSIREVSIGKRYGLSVLSVLRNGEQFRVQRGELKFETDDIILLGGREDRVMQLCRENQGLFLKGHPRAQEPFPSSTAELIEITVPPRSDAIGKSMRELQFRETTGLTAVGLWREGRAYRTDVADRALREGDALLLFGDRRRTRSFEPAPRFLFLNPSRKEEAPRELRKWGPVAVMLLGLVVIAAALDWLSIATAALAGAAGFVLLGILTPRQVYEYVDWRTVVLIAGIYPMGTALQKSGIAGIMAEGLVNALGSLGPRAVLVGVAGASLLLTQALHNVAVAAIMTPVGIDAAAAMGSDPKAFAVAVIIGASAAFVLPVGHPALLLVEEPGNYSRSDFLRYGSGLILLTLVVVGLVTPLLWRV
jgi:di/tricarboxylate transporter